MFQLQIKRLEEIAHQINRLSIDFRRGIEELKDSISRQNENFKREKEAAILAARVEAQVAALQNDGNNDSTLQPALDNENHKKVKKFHYCCDCFRLSCDHLQIPKIPTGLLIIFRRFTLDLPVF